MFTRYVFNLFPLNDPQDEDSKLRAESETNKMFINLEGKFMEALNYEGENRPSDQNLKIPLMTAQHALLPA